MPVGRRGTAANWLILAKALERQAIIISPPPLADCFCIPPADILWYLSINGEIGIIYHLLPVGQGGRRFDKLRLTAAEDRLASRTSRKGRR